MEEALWFYGVPRRIQKKNWTGSPEASLTNSTPIMILSVEISRNTFEYVQAADKVDGGRYVVQRLLKKVKRQM